MSKRKKVYTKPATSATAKRAAAPVELLYGKETYVWMMGGVLLIILGLFLMSGGKMPDPNTWDAGHIYSFRRTVLAPIVILAGLGVEIYAIFKK